MGSDEGFVNLCVQLAAEDKWTQIGFVCLIMNTEFELSITYSLSYSRGEYFSSRPHFTFVKYKIFMSNLRICTKAADTAIGRRRPREAKPQKALRCGATRARKALQASGCSNHLGCGCGRSLGCSVEVVARHIKMAAHAVGHTTELVAVAAPDKSVARAPTSSARASPNAGPARHQTPRERRADALRGTQGAFGPLVRRVPRTPPSPVPPTSRYDVLHLNLAWIAC